MLRFNEFCSYFHDFFRNPLPAKLATPASGLGDGDFQRSKSVTSSTRKARFAALAAEIDHFEIDSSHSVVIPPRYVSPKGSPVAIRKAQQADTASRSSPKMSPQATRKWSESEVKVSSPKPAEKKSVEIAVPVTSPAEKKAKIGEEDCGIETFAVPKGRDPLESVSSVDSDMVVVYNEKSSSDSDRSASPVKEQKKTEMTCLITSNLRVDRSPASVTPKKVLFSDETTMLEPTSQLHQLEANVTPKAAIASINAQSGGGDSTKVGKLASQWEQKIKSSGQKTPVVVSKSPQSIGKLVKQAVTPVENLPFGDKLKKFDSAKKPEATTHRFQTPKLSDMTKCESE